MFPIVVIKYASCFAGQGCRYFNFGADEFANGGWDMNCGTWNNNPAYNDFSADNWKNM